MEDQGRSLRSLAIGMATQFGEMAAELAVLNRFEPMPKRRDTKKKPKRDRSKIKAARKQKAHK